MTTTPAPATCTRCGGTVPARDTIAGTCVRCINAVATDSAHLRRTAWTTPRDTVADDLRDMAGR